MIWFVLKFLYVKNNNYDDNLLCGSDNCDEDTKLECRNVGSWILFLRGRGGGGGLLIYLNPVNVQSSNDYK
jgi:hypothetical protein